MNTTGSTSPPSETLSGSSSAQDATQLSQSPGVVPPSEKRFPVIELFGPVIQGEGSQAGQQTMFIRFGGCDYRCEQCDSLHAVIPQAIQKHRTMMSTQDIYDAFVTKRLETGVQWITFSGGNPCMHDLTELVNLLVDNGFYINVETQATIFREWLQACTMVTISPKSMGMGEKLEPGKLTAFVQKLGQRPLCVKVVVFSLADFETALWIKDIVDGNVPDSRLVAYYLSLGNPYPPVLDENLDLVENPTLLELGADLGSYLLHRYRDLSEEVLADRRLKVFRFLPQLHVLTYGNESKR